MTAIPADIQKAAECVYAQLGRGPDADEQAIARALMAEREACALRNIATTGIHVQDAVAIERERCAVAANEQTFDARELAQATDYGRGMDHAARTILAAIRSPQPSPTAGA